MVILRKNEKNDGNGEREKEDQEVFCHHCGCSSKHERRRQSSAVNKCCLCIGCNASTEIIRDDLEVWCVIILFTALFASQCGVVNEKRMRSL